MLDAQLGGDNDGSKGEGTAHVDGAVVEGHGGGPALGEQLRNEAEADRVLSRLSCCKTYSGGQELPKAIHLQQQGCSPAYVRVHAPNQGCCGYETFLQALARTQLGWRLKQGQG